MTKAAHEVVLAARTVLPHYGTRRLTEAEVDRLLAAFDVDTSTCDLRGMPAATLPKLYGKFRLFVCRHCPRKARPFVKLHELGHVIMGDVDEPTVLQFSGPVPETEYICDLFAAVGQTSPAERDLPRDQLGALLLTRAPLEAETWTRDRIPYLADRIHAARARARPHVGKGKAW